MNNTPKRTYIVVCQEECVLRGPNGNDAMDFYRMMKKIEPGALIYVVEFTIKRNCYNQEQISTRLLACTDPALQVQILHGHHKAPIPTPRAAA